MGMFDTFYIPAEILAGTNDENLKKYLALNTKPIIDLQTKDLDCVLNDYKFLRDSVNSEYQLYLEKIEYGEFVKDESHFLGGYITTKSREWIPSDLTETVTLCDYYTSDSADISIDIQLVLSAGKVQSVKCLHYEEKDPTARKAAMVKMKQELAASIAYRKTLRGKLALKLRQFLLRTHKALSSIADKIQRFALKL